MQAVFASQVQQLVLQHEKEDMNPREVILQSTKHSFNAKIDRGVFAGSPQKLSMKGRQFPIVSNSATTGHKLQGSTMENILVEDWMNQKHWAYVVMSRVCTMAGLKLRRRLPEDF